MSDIQNDTVPVLSSSMISGDNVMIIGGRFTQTFNDNRQLRAQNNGKKGEHQSHIILINETLYDDLSLC